MRNLRTTPREIALKLAPSSLWKSYHLPFRADFGYEVHRLVRDRYPDWTPEAHLHADICLPGLSISLCGRVDFIARSGDSAAVIEVKSITVPAGSLDPAGSPPRAFAIQTILYAWIYSLTFKDIPSSQITARLLCRSLADDCELWFDIPWTPAEAENLLKEYLAIELEDRRRRAENLRRRRRISGELSWPFPTLLPAQETIRTELSAALAEKTDILIEAPTGSGKTIAILYTALTKTLTAGRQLYYATAKGGGRSPALLAARLLLNSAPQLRVMVLSSREEICRTAAEECSSLCAGCVFYNETDSMDESAISETDANGIFDKGAATAREIAKWAAVNGRCAWKTSRRAVEYADVVIGDYNFVYDPAAAVEQFRKDNNSHWTLLLDEAHNLPERARKMLSARLSAEELRIRLEHFEDDAWRYSDEATESLIDLYRNVIADLAVILNEDAASDICRFNACAEPWQKSAMDFARLALRVLAASAGRMDKEVEEELYRTAGELETFASRLKCDRSRFVPYFDRREGMVGVGCLDAADELASINAGFSTVAAFSATLSPARSYIQSLGLTPRTTAVLHVDYTTGGDGRLLVLQAPGIETRFTLRRSAAGSVARLIADFATVSPGGVMAVFPSFDYLDMVAPLIREQGIETLEQRPGMTPAERLTFKRRLRKAGEGFVALTAAGGQFTEAEDFPGEQLVGVAVIGPCLPPPDFWREAIRAYWDEQGEDGSLIAYILPGVRKVVQAAGRMIRGEADRGIVLLADDRFLSEPIFPLLPPYWRRMLEHGFSDWKSEAHRFWGLEPVQSSAIKQKRRWDRRRKNKEQL